MNRHRSYAPLDDSPTPDGDGQFVGVNARLNPERVEAGYVAEAVNMRFETGAVATRKGVRIMAWGADGDVSANPSIVTPYGRVITAAPFSDPVSGIEWLIIVADSGVYRARPGTMGARVAVQSGLDTSAAVQLVQTFNGMVMLRGRALAPIVMASVDDGFRAMPDADTLKVAVPPSLNGIYFQNRLFVVDGRTSSQYVDSVWVSDFGGAASVLQGDAVFNAFRINQGSADRLTALAKFNDTTLVACKERSVYVVSQIYGTNEELAVNARLDEVTREYGSRSPRSFVQVGSDLWFMGHRRGVCSLRLTEQGAVRGVDVAVSRDIQGIIDRINWEQADGIVAASHDNRVYFAVPIDGASANNAVLVYSTVNQAWAGYDEGPAIRVQSWLKFSYGGTVRLGFVTDNGFIALYEDGFYDHTGDEDGVIAYNAIASRVKTRAYGGGVAGRKQFVGIETKVATWNPAYTIRIHPDGVGEGELVETVALSNTRYERPYGKANWDPANPSGDWDTPWRQDYSLLVGGVQVTDAAGAGTVAFDRHQESVRSTWIRANASSVAIEIATTRGRIELQGVALQMQRAGTREGYDL